MPCRSRPLFRCLHVFTGDGVHVASSLEAALHTSANLPVIDKVFVIGGGQLYRECLERYWRLCHYVYITRIEADCNADTFFPDTLETPQSPFRVETESEVQEEKGMRYRFCKYMQKNEVCTCARVCVHVHV